jgi:hypothetical protein
MVWGLVIKIECCRELAYANSSHVRHLSRSDLATMILVIAGPSEP